MLGQNYSKMAWDNVDAKKFKVLVKQISGTIKDADGALTPFHIIKGTGEIWCFQPSTKQVVKLFRGKDIYILDFGTEEDEQCLAMSSDGIVFVIDKDEIEEIGFN